MSEEKTRIKTRKPGTFKPGNKAAVGNKGGGRTPDWFKAKMAEIASSKEALDLVTGVIEGKDVDEFLVLQTGVQVPVKADASTRLKFLQYATDHGFGKAPQELKHSGEGLNSRLVFIFPEGDK